MAITTAKEIEELDDKTALLILSYLSQDLGEKIEGGLVVKTEAEARDALAAFLNQSGDDANAAHQIIDGDAGLLARQTLAEMYRDPEIAPRIDEFLANPPTDTQMSVEAAVAGAVVLGALITWLQTKVSLRITRADGKTKFDFAVHKGKTSDSIINDVSSSVRKLLTGS